MTKDAEASTVAKQALQVINKWSKSNHIFDLFSLYDLEPFSHLEPTSPLSDWFGLEDGIKDIPDTFLQFANDGTGGQFVLWFYPDLQGEPPVVFFGSEGQTNMLAPSLKDFVLLLTQKDLMAWDMDDNRSPATIWTDIEDWRYEEMMEDNDDISSLKKMKKVFRASQEDFTQKVTKHFEMRPVDAILAECSNHPDFIKWVESKVEQYQPTTPQTNQNELDLSGQDLSEVPKSILDNPNLESLDLSYNKLTVIPDFIGQLKHLKRLDLSSNKINCLPGTIANLTKLEDINLNHNKLTAIPEDIGQLTQLKNLFFADNKITHLPNSISTLSRLEDIELYGNKLKTLNIDFSTLPDLEMLDISDNPIVLSGLSPTLFSLTKIFMFTYDDTLIEKNTNHYELFLKFNTKSLLEEAVEDLPDSDVNDLSKQDIKFIHQIFEKRIELFPSSQNYYDYAYFYQYTLCKGYKKAEKLYDQCIARKDDDEFQATMFTDFGRLCNDDLKNRKDKAGELFSAGVKADPNDSYCLEHYANFLHYEENNEEKAAKIYKKWLKIEPDNIKVMEEYAEILLYNLDKNKKAAKIFKRILKRKKKARFYLSYLFALEMADADKDLILKTYKKAIKKHPKDKYLKEGYAKFLIEADQQEEGVEEFEELLAKKPNDIDLLFSYGQSLFSSDNYSGAKTQFAKLLSLSEDHAEAHLSMASTLEKLGEKQEIIDAHYQKAIEHKTDGHQTEMVYLVSLIRRDADKEVIVERAKALLSKTEDDEFFVHTLEEIILLKTAKLDVLEKFDAEIAVCEGDIISLLKQADKAYEQKDIPKTAAYLQAIEKIDPYHSDMLQRYTMLKTNVEGNQTAEAYLSEKLQQDPSNKNVLDALITHCTLTDQKNKAKDYIKKALKLYPDDKNFKEWQDDYT